MNNYWPKCVAKPNTYEYTEIVDEFSGREERGLK